MKIMKFFAVLAAMFAAVAVFAEKPELVSVISYSNDNSAETRVGSLVLEYYKAELSTMSGIKLVTPEKIMEAQKKMQIHGTLKNTGNPAVAQIKEFCQLTDSKYFCVLNVLNKGETQFELVASVYDAEGKQITKITKKFGAVKETDFISVTAAKETAQTIRGEKAVDAIHSAREDRLHQEIKNSKPLR